MFKQVAGESPGDLVNTPDAQSGTDLTFYRHNFIG